MVTGATIVIHDDQGNNETLVEKSTANYYTSVFQGVIGRTYSITITTGEGDTPQSAPETLTPVGDFENLRFQFVQNEPPLPVLALRSPPPMGSRFISTVKYCPSRKAGSGGRGRVLLKFLLTPRLNSIPSLIRQVTPYGYLMHLHAADTKLKTDTRSERHKLGPSPVAHVVPVGLQNITALRSCPIRNSLAMG